MRHERRRQRDDESEGDGDQRQLHVVEQRGLDHARPVVAHPVGAEEPVLLDAVARLPEVGDDRAALLSEDAAHLPTSARTSSVTTPRGSLVEAEMFGVNDERAPLWKARRDEIFDEIEKLSNKTRGAGTVRAMGATP